MGLIAQASWVLLWYTNISMFIYIPLNLGWSSQFSVGINYLIVKYSGTPVPEKCLLCHLIDF